MSLYVPEKKLAAVRLCELARYDTDIYVPLSS